MVTHRLSNAIKVNECLYIQLGEVTLRSNTASEEELGGADGSQADEHFTACPDVMTRSICALCDLDRSDTRYLTCAFQDKASHNRRCEDV